MSNKVSDTAREYASHYCSGYQTQLGNAQNISNIDGNTASKHNEKPSEAIVVTQPTNTHSDRGTDPSTVGDNFQRAVQLAPGAERFQLLPFRNQKQESTMDAMTTFAHPYGDVLSQPWCVEYVGCFLTARDLGQLCSACGVLGNTRGEYASAAAKSQHGYVRQEGSCLATLTHLKCLESIPRVCAIGDLDSMGNSWMMRIQLRRGRYYMLAYGWTYRFHTILDLFFNSTRLMPDTCCHWHCPGFSNIYRCRFPDISVEVSGFQCLICLTRPCDADAEAEIIEHRRVRLARICFVPI